MGKTRGSLLKGLKPNASACQRMFTHLKRAGSQVWGTPHESSDVDLLIVIEHSDEPSWGRAYKGYLSLFGLDVPCDVIVRTADEVVRETLAPASLIHKILAEGRVLYG